MAETRLQSVVPAQPKARPEGRRHSFNVRLIKSERKGVEIPKARSYGLVFAVLNILREGDFVMILDTEDSKRLVQNYTQESESYLRQLHVWLGTASAGGAIAMATLAANLPNPGYSFEYLINSFWCFLVGIISAGTATFSLAMRASAKGVHFASAHNRENINSALRSMPEMISSPQSMADRANTERNKLIAQSKAEHDRAEEAWASQSRWRVSWAAALVLSCLSFVGGFSWPLVQVTFLGKQIVAEADLKAQP